MRGGFAKHYVPWTFIFVRSEHTEAYRELFATTVRCARLFFGLELSVSLGSLDHAACIANAFKSTWPQILLLTCWPHAARKANEKSSLLHTDKYFENVANIHIHILYNARTKVQFLALADQAIQHWRQDGEDKYADWFSGVYLSTPWDSWFMSAAGDVRGVLPSQNPLESWHKVIKKVCVSGPKMATAAVLNDSLPGVLTVAGKPPKGTTVNPPIRHFEEEYIVRARGLLSDSSNYLKLKRVGTTEVAAVVFNALEYETCVENPSKGVKVTEARMRKYIDSLDGKLVKNKPMTEAQLLYQSLYRVQVLNSEHDPFEVSPKWSADDIRMVRPCYVCDCSESRQSGWMCEHIVATMALLEKISIDALLSVLPVRRRPGGQFKSCGALARTRFNKSDARFFGVSHLEQLFMESPAAPTHWHVTKEFSVKNRGQVLCLDMSTVGSEMAVAISGRSSSQPEKWSLWTWNSSQLLSPTVTH
ncbi:hypothetical protein DVH05_009780 [Phytophthora capsici]|nr:hypothetical protein DVH05_009780 [Phytophthora capsici]